MPPIASAGDRERHLNRSLLWYVSMDMGSRTVTHLVSRQVPDLSIRPISGSATRLVPRAFTVLALMAVFLVTFLVAGGGPAYACSCAELTPAQRMRESAAVVTATVTTVRVEEKMLNGGKRVATLRADHVYKGDPGVEFTVTTRVQGAACGYEFVAGERYLVFADRNETGLTTSLCSGNRHLPAGDRPLRLSDETTGMGPLTAELIDALGSPKPPRPTTQPPATTGTSTIAATAAGAREAAGAAGRTVLITAAGAAVVIALTTGLVFALRRRRPPG